MQRAGGEDLCRDVQEHAADLARRGPVHDNDRGVNTPAQRGCEPPRATPVRQSIAGHNWGPTGHIRPKDDFEAQLLTCANVAGNSRSYVLVAPTQANERGTSSAAETRDGIVPRHLSGRTR